MEKLTAGQTLWIKGINNRARYEAELKEVKIASVGRKYFTVEPKHYGRFEINTLTHDAGGYTPSYKVYLSKQDYENEIESSILSKEIRDAIGSYGKINLSIETLRKIKELINSQQ